MESCNMNERLQDNGRQNDVTEVKLSAIPSTELKYIWGVIQSRLT